MTNHAVDASIHKAARVAGIMFLFSLIVPLLNWTLILSKLVVADNVIATANNIIANESLFRIGLTFELIMSVGLIVLAVTLYSMLKHVNKNLALLALCFKLADAIIAAVIVLVTFIALQMLNGDPTSTAFTLGQLKAPIGLILNTHTVVFSIPMVFLGLDLILFNYLFFKSELIPGWLAGFGILSYAFILIHALMNILTPDLATMPVIQFIGYTPSIIFELIIGLWLLIKGVNVPKEGSLVSES